jgi:photosystem II stability/assembly factor-like uncharacterized protein
MSQIKYILLSFIFFLNISSKGQDFWQEIILPDSVEYVFSINFNSQSQVFICTEKGVFVSDDDGIHWDFLAGFNSSTIEISTSNEIYLGLDSQNRILYSDSNGQEWDTIQTGFDLGGRIRLINDSLLFAFDWGWISKSSNGGITWNQVLSTSNVEIFNAIEINNNILFAGSVNWINSNSGGIYRSYDAGEQWELIDLIGHGIWSFFNNENNCFITGVFVAPFTFNPGIYRFNEDGQNWENIFNEAYIGPVVSDPFGGIYGGLTATIGNSGWGVRYSPDNGVSWSELNSGLIYCDGIDDIALSPNLYIYTITSSPVKLYRSSNILVGQTELGRISETKIIIYPNPFKDNLFINTIDAYNEGEISLYTSQMKLIKSIAICPTEKTNSFCISVNSLSPGLFILKILLDNQAYTYKLLKI